MLAAVSNARCAGMNPADSGLLAASQHGVEAVWLAVVYRQLHSWLAAKNGPAQSLSASMGHLIPDVQHASQKQCRTAQPANAAAASLLHGRERSMS